MAAMVGSPPLSPTGFAQYIQPRRGINIIRILAIGIALTLFIATYSLMNVSNEWKLPTSYRVSELLNPSTQSEGSQQSQDLDVPQLYTTASSVLSVETTLPNTPSSSLVDSDTEALAKSKAQKDALAEAKAHKDALAEAQALKDSAKEAAAKLKSPAPKVETAVVGQPTSGKSRPVYYNIHDGKPFDIDQGVRDVLKLLPDEIYTRDLLRPIVGGGEERLHEVGLRARLFQKYFAAWEALHVVSDGSEGAALVRDDVIQYLRDAPDVSAISSLPRADITRSYEQYRSFMTNFSSVLFPWTAPYFSDHMTIHAHSYSGGRGIVVTGNDDVAPYMITAIATFREMGCSLPIEVFYLGDNDLGDEFREELEALPGVTTRNLKQMVADQGWDLAGWASKAFSILMSSFREVLFVDADALFFRNPEILFDDPAYAETGALFFYDRLMAPQTKKRFLRKIMPKPISEKARSSRWWTGDGAEMQESGVMVIDKWRHFVSLLVVTRLNGPDRDDRDGNKGVYSFFYGDKETFWLGFELAGDTDYSFHTGNAGAMGLIDEVEKFLDQDQVAAKMLADGLISPDWNAGQTSNNVGSNTGSESQNEPPKQDSQEQPSQQDSRPDQSAHGFNKEHKPEDLHSEKSSSENHVKVDDIESYDKLVKTVEEAAQKGVTPAITSDQEESKIAAVKNEELRDSTSDIISDNPGKVTDDQGQHQNARRDTPEKFVETVKAEGVSFEELSEMKGANYSMWSPQLLHLDRLGQPLWFNGWIQKSKWNHDKNTEVSKWEYYLSERRLNPASGRDSMAEWGTYAENMARLKSDHVYKFTDEELATLAMIVRVAKSFGAIS